MKIVKLPLTRAGLLYCLYAMDLLAAIYEFDFDLSGTPKKGSALYHDGNGNSIYAEWTARDLLLMAWYHDSPNVMDTDHLKPRQFDSRYAKGVPAKLKVMLKRGAFLLAQPAITAAAWGIGEDLFANYPAKKLHDCGFEMLGDLTKPADLKWLTEQAKFHSSDGKADRKILDFVVKEAGSSKYRLFGSTHEKIRKSAKIQETVVPDPVWSTPVSPPPASGFYVLRGSRLDFEDGAFTLSYSDDSFLETYLAVEGKKAYIFQCRTDMDEDVNYVYEIDAKGNPQSTKNIKVSVDDGTVFLSFREKSGWGHESLGTDAEWISTKNRAALKATKQEIERTIPGLKGKLLVSKGS